LYEINNNNNNNNNRMFNTPMSTYNRVHSHQCHIFMIPLMGLTLAVLGEHIQFDEKNDQDGEMLIHVECPIRTTTTTTCLCPLIIGRIPAVSARALSSRRPPADAAAAVHRRQRRFSAAAVASVFAPAQPRRGLR
jgi:hypothetical protein